MSTVYRLEHTTIHKRTKNIGLGCYTTNIFTEHQKMCDSHQGKYGSKTHPSIRTDIKRDWNARGEYYRQNFFCGFDSLEKLNTWLYGWKGKLLKEGFVVVKYEVDGINAIIPTYSELQLMFHKDRIKEKTIVQTKYGYINQ